MLERCSVFLNRFFLILRRRTGGPPFNLWLYRSFRSLCLLTTAMASTNPEQWALRAGPPFVGFMLNWGLLGVLLVQVHLYHALFPRDGIHFKALVYGIFILDCVQTFLLSSDFFEGFVYQRANEAAFSTIGTGWFSFIILGGVISAAVQTTFAWRLWLLTKSRALVGTILVLTTSQLSGSIVTGLQLRVSSDSQGQKNAIAPFSIWLSGSALVDVIIAISMTVLLSRARANGQLFKANMQAHRQISDPVVNRLIVFIIETGTLTASVAIITLILFFASRDTHLHECTAIIISKLYSNTLLAGFNNRARLKKMAASSPSLPSMLVSGDVTALSFESFPALESALRTPEYPTTATETVPGEGVLTHA